MMGSARMSETRVLYPNDAPRSHSRIRWLPVLAIFAATFVMSHGARNWPFFTLIAAPVSPAASNRSVWRERKAGICRMSTASAAGPHCSAVWTSVSTGRPVRARMSARMARPASIPMPRAAPTLVRFALS